MKRNAAAFICMLLSFLIFPFYTWAQAPPLVNAEGAVLMDADSGRMLYGKNAHKNLPPASTTKIVTAILALEEGNLDDRTVISKYAEETQGSSIWLEEGEIHKLEDLLYASLLSSANDASVAIAEHIGGSEADFVHMMNRKAGNVGALNTHFSNPHGLHDDNHLSTAYDLALLGRYAMGIPKFREIVATKKRVIPWAGHEWSRMLVNKNRLIKNPNLYPHADGVKNGYTRAAGNCLVASAVKGNMRLIAVVLDASNASEEAVKLLDYGFENFERVQFASRGEKIHRVKSKDGHEIQLTAAEPLSVALKKDEKRRINKIVSVPDEISVDVRKGDILGQLIIELEGEKLGSVNLLSHTTVVKNPWLVGFFRKIFSSLTFMI